MLLLFFKRAPLCGNWLLRKDPMDKQLGSIAIIPSASNPFSFFSFWIAIVMKWTMHQNSFMLLNFICRSHHHTRKKRISWIKYKHHNGRLKKESENFLPLQLYKQYKQNINSIFNLHGLKKKEEIPLGKELWSIFLHWFIKSFLQKFLCVCYATPWLFYSFQSYINTFLDAEYKFKENKLAIISMAEVVWDQQTTQSLGAKPHLLSANQ